MRLITVLLGNDGIPVRRKTRRVSIGAYRMLAFEMYYGAKETSIDVPLLRVASYTYTPENRQNQSLVSYLSHH
jgi:hypothetical protein